MMKSVIALAICLTSFNLLAIGLSASGSSGWSGSNGSDGWYAGSGGDGSSGSSAGDIELFFSENGGDISISGTVENSSYSKIIDSYAEVISLYANGGDAGSGGDGGDGYDGHNGSHGASGYDGRDGYRGQNGRNGTRYSPDGGDGSNGGRGEDGGNGFPGGDGGNGGNAGNGGSGGNGGNGGRIVVKYDDPAVLMHLSYSVRAGYGGSAGDGGDGGRGGYGGSGGRGGYGGDGGYGGRGGSGYNCTTQEEANGCRDGSDGSNGWSGSDGSNGWSGPNGSDGYWGADGSDGISGYSGSRGSFVAHQVNGAGNIVNTINGLGNIYRLKVIDFTYVDANDDSILEPNESFTITSITIQNMGGMSMPEGAILEFKGDAVGYDKLTLPSFNAGETKTFTPNFVGNVPAGSEIGASLSFRSNVTFRGLKFSEPNVSATFKVQRPLNITSVDYEEYVAFSSTKKLTVMVSNISSKAYATGVIKFGLDGNVLIKEIKGLENITPGSSDQAVIEYEMPGSLSDYERADLYYELYRDDTFYAQGSKSVQVVPTYKYSSSSDLLILSNGFTRTAFSDVKAKLKELRLDYDVYDINLNGSFDKKSYSKYKGRQVLIAKFKSISSSVKESLNNYLNLGSGVGILNSDGFVSSTNYRYRSYVSSKSFFKLSSKERKNLVENAVLTPMPNSRKLSYILSAYKSGASSRMRTMSPYYEGDIYNEYRYGKDVDNNIYDKEDTPLIKDFGDLYRKTSPATDFSLKLYLSNMVPNFLKYDSGGLFMVTFNKFRNWFEEAEDESDDYQALAASCGEINGTYVDVKGNEIEFEPTFSGKNIKAKFYIGDEKVKLKAEKSNNKIWDFEYDYDGDDYIAQARMTCSGSLIKVKLNFGHSNQSWTLTKTEVYGLE